MPLFIAKYLDMASSNYSYIYGDFEICPVEPDIPGHMRSVCVMDAKKLVVQNLTDPRPAFKLLSTWPAAGADSKKRR